jgi:4-diphosphocytidyl-2-C-methyl-D-erythritol kinase
VFLRITGKRPDGYHDLASLFHVISLGDIIKFSISPSTTKDSLTTNASGVPLDEKNLIIKAFNLYRRKTGTQKYFWVHLDKQVPTGAGLGGGSGNAATALWAANQMNGNIASEKELQAWSAEIGSDCPFFFSQGAAYCTSRGEVVRDIAPPISLDTPMVLIKPKEECSTAEVYKLFSMERVSKKDPEELLREISQNGISQNVCINDLEPPAFEVLPALKALKERVAAAGRGRYQAVFMSGSGSTIVGVGDSEPPQFIYDEEQYRDTFISGLHITSLFRSSVTVAAVPSKSVRHCQLVSCVIDVVALSQGQAFLFPRNFNEIMYLFCPSTSQVLSMMCNLSHG